MADGISRRDKNRQLEHLDLETVNAVSSTDFTGLIPSNPLQAEDSGAYEDIHGFGNDTPV